MIVHSSFPVLNTFYRARNNLSTVVEPLLNLIREMTGYYLVLFAGKPNVSGLQEFDLRV